MQWLECFACSRHYPYSGAAEPYSPLRTEVPEQLWCLVERPAGGHCQLLPDGIAGGHCQLLPDGIAGGHCQLLPDGIAGGHCQLLPDGIAGGHCQLLPDGMHGNVDRDSNITCISLL